MLHASLESKAPWCSAGQSYYRFFCNHPSVSLLSFFFPSPPQITFLIFGFAVYSSNGALSALTPWLTIRAPLAELCRRAPCLPHRPAADVSLGPPSRPSLGNAHAHARAPTSIHHHMEARREGGGWGSVVGGGLCVSAYTEECLPQKSKGSVQCNTCPVTQVYVTGLLIAPPKIGWHHHLCCFCLLICTARKKGNPQKCQMTLI